MLRNKDSSNKKECCELPIIQSFTVSIVLMPLVPNPCLELGTFVKILQVKILQANGMEKNSVVWAFSGQS